MENDALNTRSGSRLVAGQGGYPKADSQALEIAFYNARDNDAPRPEPDSPDYRAGLNWPLLAVYLLLGAAVGIEIVIRLWR